MSRDYPHHPLPAVLAMVTRGGTVLLARRGKGETPDPWGFPGGLIEVGESVLAAAERELAEETGIQATAERVAEVLDIIIHDGDGRVRSHFIANAVRMTWISGEPVAASDVVECGWFTLAEIAGMSCHPNLPRLAAALFTEASHAQPAGLA